MSERYYGTHRAPANGRGVSHFRSLTRRQERGFWVLVAVGMFLLGGPAAVIAAPSIGASSGGRTCPPNSKSWACVTPTPSPSGSPTPSPTATQTPSPTPSTTPSPSPSVSPTGNPSGLPWRSGVHTGSFPADYAAFATWRGRPLDSTLQYSARDSWAGLESPWFLGYTWPGELIAAQPFWPEGSGGSFAACAAGDYDTHWRAYGTRLTAAGKPGPAHRVGPRNERDMV
jgi:Predicted solute binding protein